jgi:predicted ester cyclase
MPTPDALVREWFDQVWNRLDESAIDRMLAPDAIVHGLGPEPLRGPAGFKPFFHAFKDGLADIRVQVERVVVDDDTCAAYCRVVARHTGDTLGGPATNRPVDFTGFTMVRVRDGQLVEGWNQYDFLSLYQQLGWIPTPVRPVATP